MKRTLVFLAILLGLATPALAQTTAAGTQIQNQASATYTDSSGNPQVATSNLAVTVVQQVYAVSVKPDNSNAPTPAATNFALAPDPSNDRQAVPGSTVNLGYTITNAGNGSDSFTLTTPQGTTDNFDLTGVAIYQDINGNGLRDPGEPQITSAISLVGGGSMKIVVVGTVPATATNTQTALIDLSAVSVGGGATVVDNNNIGRVTVINDANLTLNKAASGPDASNQITYTISGSNNGSQAAKSKVKADGTNDGILIEDAIPAGTTLVISPAPTGSSGSLGTTQVVYFVGGAWTTTASATATKIGLLMLDPTPANSTSENTLSVSGNYTLSFKVTIGAGVSGGSNVTNQATITYLNQSGTAFTAPSNTTTTAIAPTYATAIGPVGAPTAAGAADIQTAVAPVAAGTTVSFTNTVRNTGNVSDSFAISLDGTSVLPAGYAVQFYQSDGVTPLSGNISLAAGADYNVVVKVTIPANAAIGSAATAVVKSISQTDTTKTDTTQDKLTVTVAAGVLFGNSDAVVTTVSATPINRNTNAGTPASFPMDIVNTGGSPDSFNLSGTVSIPLVGGGTQTAAVLYYPLSADSNSDGVLSAAEIAAASSVSNTGSIAAGGETKLFAVVNVPTNAASTGAALPVLQTITSPISGQTASFNTDTVTVNANHNLVFSPNQSGTTTSPGTLVYPHTVQNNGNVSETITFNTAAGSSNFTYIVYSDTNSNGVVDASDTVLYNGTSPATLTVAAGASAPVLVQVTAASGLPATTVDARQINATAGTTTDNVIDTTTIVAGELQLSKTATLVNDANGDGKVEPRTYLTANALLLNRSEIKYEVRARNVGTASLANIIVFDPVPTYTDFKFGSAVVAGCPTGATCTVQYSTDNGATWTATAPTDTNTNGYSDDATRVTNVRVVITNAGSTPVNAFPTGSNTTLTFVVSVR